MRAVDGILATYGGARPAGAEPVRWAVWEFPINVYLALMPAALERAGVSLPEHYAIREGLAAARRLKQEVRKTHTVI